MCRNRARLPSPIIRSRIFTLPSPISLSQFERIVAGAAGRRTVLDRAEQELSGSIILIRANSWPSRSPHAWFTYYYWLDERRAPDFARLVEIHRKPGYDPVELFSTRRFGLPKLAIGWRLASRALGLRTLMDVIPLDASLVKGSHGRPTDNERDGPIFISSEPRLVRDGPMAATQVKAAVLSHIFD